ncbi:RNA recognition motif 2-domain-containing protein [Xylariales sp. PMI_506]|nr:RNA recognition motif 2-domain-containing protein [Xylariales sp. PMI_506]
MALPQPREGSFNPTSPRSSSEVAESFKSTPDTHLTGLSPEDGSTKFLRAQQSSGRSSGPIKFEVSSQPSRIIPHRSPFFSESSTVEKDPFVNPAVPLSRKLSPTASCFAPGSRSENKLGDSFQHNSQEINADMKHLVEKHPRTSCPASTDKYVHTLLSTDMNLSRCVVVYAEIGAIQQTEIEEYLARLSMSGFQTCYATRFHHSAKPVYVRFANIRDACLFVQQAECEDRGWRTFNRASGFITAHEGQLTLAVFGASTLQDVDPTYVHIFIQGVLLSQGDLFAFKPLQNGVEGSLLSAIIEYSDENVSQKAVSNLSSKVLDSSMSSVTPSYFSPLAKSSPSTNYQNIQPSFGVVPVVYQVRVHRSPYHHHNVSSQHNVVDVDRIRQGIDVRTTIMLRNIPNKVDQAMLKGIVDESSWGKYDFMYLRIDFANDCNVGYAFINFVDPLDIIDFVTKRGNQRWNCFKSDKVAEISYATIQGKDCLVQKFRNSSVMLEASHYRPKLYYTINGPRPELAGNEEPFPEPDNHSKMKRSCENAEHVGLFTPNAGQHFRDEQRRRRSQYDRGTRLAALEEYDYDSNFHQPQRHSNYPPQ